MSSIPFSDFTNKKSVINYLLQFNFHSSKWNCNWHNCNCNFGIDLASPDCNMPWWYQGSSWSIGKLTHWPLGDAAVILYQKFSNTDQGQIPFKHFLWNCSSVNSLQNKIWNFPEQFCQNLYIFIYDKEGKLAGPTQILPVNVRGPALILKTGWIL